MSYSYPRAGGPAFGIINTMALCLGVSAPVGLAFAAETYVQPKLELRLESSSNFNLDPITNDQSDTRGAIADLAALIGIATPRSETTIRPRLKLQRYTDRSNFENYEAFFDLNSGYRSEKSEFDVFGRFSRRNTIDAVLSDAQFDDLNQGDPTNPDSGNNSVGETRDRLDFRPTYSYKLSERTSIGGEVLFQGVRYSSEVPLTRVEYDYLQGEAFVQWAINERSDFTVSAYASNYDARQSTSKADAVGAGLGISHRWSEKSSSEIEVTYERNDTTDGLIPVKESSNDLGVNFSTYMKGEVDQWRFTAGRSYAPNGRGGKSAFDQARFQYDRDLRERLHFMGAARYVKDGSISQVGNTGDREYSRLELSLTWFASPKWYVAGGYQYTYQDRAGDPDSADDNRFMLSVGYQGLGRESR